MISSIIMLLFLLNIHYRRHGYTDCLSCNSASTSRDYRSDDILCRSDAAKYFTSGEVSTHTHKQHVL